MDMGTDISEQMLSKFDALVLLYTVLLYSTLRRYIIHWGNLNSFTTMHSMFSYPFYVHKADIYCVKI